MYIGGVGGAANGIFIDTGLFKRLDIVCVLTVTCIRKYHEIYYIYIHVCLCVCVYVCVRMCKIKTSITNKTGY